MLADPSLLFFLSIEIIVESLICLSVAFCTRAVNYLQVGILLTLSFANILIIA